MKDLVITLNPQMSERRFYWFRRPRIRKAK